MHLDYTRSGGVLSDADNFRQLDVRVPAAMDVVKIRDWLEGLGATLEGEHVWILESSLRRLGCPSSSAWLDNFDDMLEYADRAGWVRVAEEVRQVRAHLITN